MLTPADLMDTLNNPQTAHGAMIHAPIVLTAVSFLVALVSASLLGKSRAMRWVTLVVCVAACAGAWGAKITGERVYDEMGDPPGVARELAHEHEELGEQLALLSVVPVVLALGVWFPKGVVAGGAAWLTVLACGAGALWGASAGKLGGELVYDYGIGTPKPVTELDLSPEPSRFAGDPRLARYDLEVRPVLSRYCFKCHGSTGKVAAGLRLTTAASIFAGGENGPAVIPGDAEGSLLFQTVRGTHPEIGMPPGPRTLSEDEIEVVRRWIDEGAVWVAAD